MYNLQSTKLQLMFLFFRVVLGTLEEFLSTSCVTNLSFLSNAEEGEAESLSSSVKQYLERELNKPFMRVTTPMKSQAKRKQSIRSRKSGVTGIIRRTRSIQVDQYDPGICTLIFCPLCIFQ